MPWWLETPDGGRVPLRGGGALLGRAATCELVLTDPRASRRHALITAPAPRPELVSLGRGRTEVGGVPVDDGRALREGDVVTVPGLSLTVRYQPEEDLVSGRDWVLQHGQTVHGVSTSPFTVGGGDDDALRIEGWPPSALCFWRTDTRVSVETAATARVDGRPVEAGELIGCVSGTRIERDDTILRVLIADDERALASTVTDEAASEDVQPRSVRLAFLPRGARLYLADARAERAAYLPERRAELVSLLLRPPEPYAAGELIPDEVLLTRLWPRQTKTPNDLHVLVHRVRKSLVAAGIDGAGLIARDGPAGSTRFVLAAGARIVLE